MKNLVLENEKLIEKFDIDFFKNNKNYSVVSALAALETTNEIQKSFFKEDNQVFELSDHILRLYALLQGLFVSIDSLYALSYSLTKSKNFINVNLNPVLRELKYIRNDVVGHPANRMYDSSTLAYCILDNKSITNKGFSYLIYSKDDVLIKNVDIIQLVNSYYLECNNYLKEMYDISLEFRNKGTLENTIIKCIDVFQTNGNFLPYLSILKEEYLKQFPNACPNQHRILWRIDLIYSLINYDVKDYEIKNLIEYSIGIQLLKIMELIKHSKEKLALSIRTPNLVSSFYRFLNRNKDLVGLINNIYDIKDPKFRFSLNELYQVALNKKIKGVIKYLDLIRKLKKEENDSLVFALTAPILEYKKKK